MVSPKAADCEWGRPQDADPADALGAYQRVEQKIKPDCGSKRQQRAGELPGREPEEDGLPVFPDFFGDFYFDRRSLLFGQTKNAPLFSDAPNGYSLTDILRNSVTRGRFAESRPADPALAHDR